MRKAGKGKTNYETLVEYCVSFINKVGFLDDQGKFKKMHKEFSPGYLSIAIEFENYGPLKDVRAPLDLERTLFNAALCDRDCWELAKSYIKWLLFNEIQIDTMWNILILSMIYNNGTPSHLHNRGNRETDYRNACIRALDHILKTKFNLDLLGSSKNEDRLPYRAEIISDVLGRVASVKLMPEGVKKIIQRTEGQN